MPTLIDSSLWIHFTRARSPRSLKQFIAPYILAPEAALAEPIVYEVLRHATDSEIRAVRAQFSTLPLLQTPDDLWTSATRLGQACRRKGISAGSLDLLIAAVAIHHDAQLVTLDRDFEGIAGACDLRVKLLQRPAP
ncbi:MAG TPA: PIN domain-containing protein [Humisphaera sp.]|nr:PIN domain-containing protein [Humisphaera sp.]